MKNFFSIDCHAHYEPRILNVHEIIDRMKNNRIKKTCLISAVTKEPIYKKSDFLMGIQRNFLQNSILWYFAKQLDKGFHKNKGKWDPWYRKFLLKGKSYEIIQKPDNKTVFEIAEKYSNYFYSWIFLNPTLHEWDKEFIKWHSHSKSIGIKLHPFWHRYSVDKAIDIAKVSKKFNLPIMIHLGFDEIENIKKFLLLCKDNTIIFSHAGFPFYKWIWPFIKEHEHCYVDFSSHHVNKKIINECVDFLGPNRCLFGTDDPYGDEKTGFHIQKWIEELRISDDEKKLILFQNSQKIFKMKF